ncbi:MAG: GNAT family N-acetyltransferase [Actinomycetota bacterium]
MIPESRRPFFSWWWSQSYMELERDTRVLVDGGRIVAVGMGAREDAAHAFFEASGRVDPEHVGRGLGTWLLAWLARAGVGRGASWVRNACPAEDGAAARLFRAAGYAYARTAWDMGVGLAGDEPAGEPLDGIEIRPYRSGLDDRDLWRVMTVSFRDHWDHEADPSFESFMASWFADPADPPVVWMATAAGVPVGEVAWIHVPEGAYVISVAVLPEHRRKGIATALLRAAIIDMAGRGIADVSLSVDSENPTGAVRAYERVGMTVRRTTHVYHLELA